ncbi:uncharacterized protein [Triticum aestivum]|uniref:uncharacterized protein n=1 Tax=Triticum aestivum TaxID=4565 RepID=UPI001D004611|nr:uncharacterized protein LOC123092266 [Triticum aestivum]
MGAPLLRLCMYMSLSRPCISTSRTLKCLQSLVAKMVPPYRIKELMAEDHSEATSWLWLPSRVGYIAMTAWVFCWYYKAFMKVNAHGGMVREEFGGGHWSLG